jgi:hypothetical protein
MPRFKSKYNCIAFEVHTAVTRSSVFWVITRRNPVKANRRFEGTYCFHLQGQRVREARYQHEAESNPMMEEIYSSKTFAEFHWSTRHYAAGNKTLQIKL